VNKSDIMKWLLIAGAAYLVYRYLQQSGVFGKPQVAAGAGDGSQPDTGVGTGAAKQIEPPASTATVAQTPTIAQALTAAMKSTNYDPYADYNGYEWGWFWERTALYNGVPIGPTELGISDTTKVPMSEAVNAIRKILAGVAGLDTVGDTAGVNLGVLNAMMSTPRMISAWSM
jgi:hypothetical protein